jgi:hypothetical protein
LTCVNGVLALKFCPKNMRVAAGSSGELPEASAIRGVVGWAARTGWRARPLLEGQIFAWKVTVKLAGVAT